MADEGLSRQRVLLISASLTAFTASCCLRGSYHSRRGSAPSPEEGRRQRHQSTAHRPQVGPAGGGSGGSLCSSAQAHDSTAAAASATTSPRSVGSSPSAASTSSMMSPQLLAPLEGVFGVDIGGTLAKLVFLEKLPNGTAGGDSEPFRQRQANFITAREHFGSTGQRYSELEFASARLGGVLHFIKFETRRLDNALKIVQQAGLVDGMKRVYMSGGGAFKFAALIEEQLRVKCVPVDEFEALVWGIDYVLEDGPPDEVYTMQGQGQGQGQGGDASGAGGLRTMAEVVVHPGECLSQPYMVVNIGSGVSFLKVRPLSSMDGGSFPRFERCGGTAIGGATFWGMARLMTDASTFEEVMELCRKGDAGQVDKLVKDIYGGDYAKVGLKGDVIASSFGKLCAMDNPKQQARQEDLALALLKMITAQITNLAANVAKLHGVSRIFFVGGFLRFNEISRPQIAHFCMRYFNIQALFLRHAEFLGAIGALDEASRDQGLGVEYTHSKGQAAPDSPRLHGLHAAPARRQQAGGREPNSGGGGGGGGGGGRGPPPLPPLTIAGPAPIPSAAWGSPRKATSGASEHHRMRLDV